MRYDRPRLIHNESITVFSDRDILDYLAEYVVG